VVRLSIPAQLSFRDLAHSAVLAVLDAEDSEVHPDARGEVISALSEAFNNVVIHAYRGMGDGQIELVIDAAGGELEIQVLDRGRGFEIDDVPDPDLDALPESGMGLFIIRSFIDQVTYTRGGGTAPNVLVMRKRWAASRGESPASESTGATLVECSGASPGKEGAARTDASSTRKETSQSGWRMRSVAVPIHAQSTAGSLKRK